jgi:3-oxoacyl-[acyl-carrier protein] reductase
MSPGAAEGGSVFRPGVVGSAGDASSLQGASVLVTGGTRGIGRAIALRLVADGAARAVLGYMRNDAAAEEAAALIQEAGAEAVLVRGNVADARTVEELAAAGP